MKSLTAGAQPMMPRHSRQPTLTIVGSKSNDVREIQGPDFHIGRLPDLDLFIDDGRVSRPHARIQLRSDGLYELVDLKSQNGTLHNGKKLTPYQPVRLRDGDRVKIVEQELIFHHTSSVVREEEIDRTTVLRSLDDLSSARLVEQSTHPATVLKAVLEVVRALGGGADLGEVLGRALDGLLAVFPRAERAFVATIERDGSLLLAAFRSRRGGDSCPTFSRSIRDRVLRDGQAVLIKDILLDEVYTSESITSSIRSAVCVPLRSHEGHPMGMVRLDRQAGSDMFGEKDLELLAALALPIGVAIENHRLLQERASWTAARKIQLALLPRSQPRVAGFRFWECYRPAQEVGGDLYDYIPVEPTMSAGEPSARWAIVLGDVAGKGMPAALISASIRPEIRVLARNGVPPDEVLSRVNRQIFDQEIDGRFVTLLFCLIDPEANELFVANAGHPLALVRHASGLVEEIVCAGVGPPLGAVRDARYRPSSLVLQPGDTVVLYSDGVIDAHDRKGGLFGLERLRRELAEAPSGVAPAGEAILAAVRNHSAGRSQFDDITLVCFGRDAE
jgi:serine phosphatase RsbU (regulator of sigma subunit)/pSer/pThr/pTyr-binding forkhead associated (FHA) protein